MQIFSYLLTSGIYQSCEESVGTSEQRFRIHLFDSAPGRESEATDAGGSGRDGGSRGQGW